MSRNILQGLIGAWCPTLGPSGYTLLDRSGRGTHASLQNFSALPWSASPGGWEASFAASSTNRALCSRPVLSGTTDFTISAWINPISVAGTVNEFVVAGNYGAGNTAGVQINGYNGKFGVYVAASPTILSTATLAAGVYSMVTATRLGGVVSLYLSGALDSTATRTGSITTTRNWAIGNGPDYTGGHGGRIDDQGVWNRALTAPEVWQLYQSGRGGLGRLLTPQRRSYAFKVPATVKSYLFVNRGQVIGGGTL